MEKITKRELLKRTGVVAGAPSVSSLAAAGKRGKPDTQNTDGPTRVEGKRKITRKYTADKIVVEEWYTGDALVTNYGRPKLKFDQWTIDREGLPEATNVEMLHHGVDVDHFPLDTLVGTREEWEQYYNQRDEALTSDGSTEDRDYSGPIYEWAKSHGGDTYTIKAPINVVVDTDKSLSDVADVITDNGYHPIPVCATTKYVGVWNDGSVEFISDDRSLGTQAFCGDSQNHIRLWDADNVTHGDEHVGSIHWDPLGHNQGCAWDNFNFEEAEQDMRALWNTNTNADVHSRDLSNAREWPSYDCYESNDSKAATIQW